MGVEQRTYPRYLQREASMASTTGDAWDLNVVALSVSALVVLQPLFMVFLRWVVLREEKKERMELVERKKCLEEQLAERKTSLEEQKQLVERKESLEEQLATLKAEAAKNKKRLDRAELLVKAPTAENKKRLGELL